MLFNSLHFLVFFIVVTTTYFAIPHKYRWFLLLASSCYFYMVFVPIYILILGFTIVIDYFAGIFLENTQGKRKKWFLIASLIANIGVLAIFKYYNFLNNNLSILIHGAGYENPIPYLSILLPIGLSFHTFQAMSYTIEVYRGVQKAERHFGIYSLYVMFSLSVATSIDALAVGLSFALLQIHILLAISIIGFVTFVMSYIGVQIGCKLGSALGNKAEIIGGIILICMGVKVLIEHLYYSI